MSSDYKYDKSLIELRRTRVLELSARGMSQHDISLKLNVSTATVSLDLQYARCKAQEQLQHHIQEEIPLQHSKIMSGLHQVLQKAWDIADNTVDERTRLQALVLIDNCYEHIRNTSTDATTIGEAMRFVMDNTKNKNQSDDISSDESLTQQQDPSPLEEEPIQESSDDS